MISDTCFKLIEVQQGPEQSMAVVKQRIRKIGSFSLLGPPDLLHITRVKTKTQFLSKPKKETKTSYMFFTGLNIQNVAFLNSYVNKMINYERKLKTGAGDIEKAYFCIFDAFKRIDVHVQICIPGNTRVFSYDRNQKKVEPIKQEAYISAFFSSTLRAMHIKHFPFLKIYDEISNIKFIKNFSESFIPFAVTNHIEGTQSTNHITNKGNFSIYLLIKYLIDRDATAAITEVLHILKGRSPVLQQLFGCQVALCKENYRKVVKSAASILVDNCSQPAFLYVQARALLQCKRYEEAIKIGRSIVFMGQASYYVWLMLAKAYFYAKQYNTLLILMNTALTLCEQPEEFLNVTSRQMTKLEIPNSMLVGSTFNVIKPVTIKECSLLVDYYFKFDNWFLDKFGKIRSLTESLKKSKKQAEIASFLERSEKSLRKTNGFYKVLVMLERAENWNLLLKLRNRIFWLESDFQNISQMIYDTYAQTNTTLETQQAFFQPGLQMNEKSFVALGNQSQKLQGAIRSRILQETTESKQSQKELPRLVIDQQDRIQGQISRNEKSFDLDPNKLSETEIKKLQETLGIQQLQPCSARIKNLTLENRQALINETYRNKVLSCTLLQSLFNDLYEDLVLQLELENWMKNLSLPAAITLEQSEIISVTLLKKAFLNKKLMRYRKVEETLKLCMNYAKRNLTKIVCVHTLAQIYVQTKNFKAALTHLQELLGYLNQIGLKQLDVLPLWLQQLVLPTLKLMGSAEKIRATLDKWRSGFLLSAFELCYTKFKAQL